MDPLTGSAGVQGYADGCADVAHTLRTDYTGDMETREEYRALIGRPASILDSPADRERGHVEEWSGHAESMEAVKRQNYSLSRTEETHAWAIRWERRTVTLGEWVPA